MGLLYDVRTKQKKTTQRRVLWSSGGRYTIRVVPPCWRKPSVIWRLCVLSEKHDTTMLGVDLYMFDDRKTLTCNKWDRLYLSGHVIIKRSVITLFHGNRYEIVQELWGVGLVANGRMPRGRNENRNVFRAALTGRLARTSVYAKPPSSLRNVWVNRGKKSSSRQTNERKSRR